MTGNLDLSLIHPTCIFGFGCEVHNCSILQPSLCKPRKDKSKTKSTQTVCSKYTFSEMQSIGLVQKL